MKNIKDVCVLVQARLGSTRCPNKMARKFADSTLTDLIAKKIKNSSIIPEENFYLAVHEPELVEIGKRNKVNIFHRSEASAKSEGTPMTELYEWWDKLPFKYVVMINACCPLLKIETIDDFVKGYLNSNSNGMFGVIGKKNYFWSVTGECLTPLTEDVMNTKTVPIIYEAAHCLYASSMKDIGNCVFMGSFKEKGDIELFPVPEEEIFDIDYEWEFDLYEALYKHVTGESKK